MLTGELRSVFAESEARVDHPRVVVNEHGIGRQQLRQLREYMFRQGTVGGADQQFAGIAYFHGVAGYAPVWQRIIEFLYFYIGGGGFHAVG